MSSPASHDVRTRGQSLDTRHVRPSEREDAPFRSTTLPIHRASTVLFDDLAAFENRASQLYDGFSYGLYGTPTSRRLEDHIAELEGARRALVTPSGLSAIAVATLAVARAGDRILVPESMYGPAKDLVLRLLGPLGIETAIYDPRLDGAIADHFDARTRLVWVESPGSSTFEVQDVPAIVQAARRRGALVAADNTWASHLLFRPLDHGVDISMQALSKHAGGHGDLLMGSLAVGDVALFRRLKDIARLLGYGVSADDCALCERGLKTMPLRLRHSAHSAETIMGWLEQRPEVARVLHPSRRAHPGHDFWRRDFSGGAGVFGVVLKPCDRPRQHAALNAMKLFRLGASWGSVHSLVAPSDPHRGRTSCSWLPDGPYWRLSIGLEAVEDLIADLDAAFQTLARPAPVESVAHDAAAE